MIDSTETLTKALAARRASASGPPTTTGRPAIGFVPTMGALHAGHLSLIAAARASCHTVVLSVFVNPTQFGPGEDLANYPRDPDGDRLQAAAAGVDILFAPSTREIYPSGPRTLPVEPPELGARWEGAARPGHFEGVVAVVSRLFQLMAPCRAYFGEKDYQQLLVVRQLVCAQALPVEVVACATLRESDGLALSSRNARLAPPERRAAAVLYAALLAGRALIEAGERNARTVQAAIEAAIQTEPRARLDYVAVTDPTTLAPAQTPLRGDLRLLVAARLGGVRLIDNLGARAA